jgi:hypothetical protein
MTSLDESWIGIIYYLYSYDFGIRDEFFWIIILLLIKKVNTKMRTITLWILSFTAIITSLQGQGIELDLGAGVHVSNINFHHTSNVDSVEASEFQSFGNSNFNIGVTSLIGKKNFYLRTEIGFIKTNSFFSASYKYDEGF